MRILRSATAVVPRSLEHRDHHDIGGEENADQPAGLRFRQVMTYAGTGAAAGRAFNISSAKNALRLRPAEIASTPMPM